jgi:putative MFS transporter
VGGGIDAARLRLTCQEMTPILERLDSSPLKRLHGLAALLCAVAFGIDLLEISIGNALSAVFSAPPYSLGPSVLSWILASAYIGAVTGAPIVGRIADRKGIQRTLAATLLWLGLMSLLAFTQSTPVWFGSFRLLSGIALGAYPPLMIAYLTAIAPSGYRGLMIFWVCALAYLAPPFGIFLIRWLTPLHPFDIAGWRWPFAYAGIAALIVSLGFLWLPESPRWLLTLGRAPAAERICEAFERSPMLRLPSILSVHMGVRAEAATVHRESRQPTRPRLGDARPFVMTLYFLHPWFTIAFPLLTGPMLLKRGYRLTDALLYIAVSTMGPVVSTLLTGTFVDRVGRRIALTLSCGVMLLAVSAFFYTERPVALASAIIVFAIGAAVYTPLMTTYGAELFPSTTRASATTLAWAVNRMAAVLVPVGLLPLFAARGPPAIGWEVTVALLATMALIAVYGPSGAAGRNVQ